MPSKATIKVLERPGNVIFEIYRIRAASLNTSPSIWIQAWECSFEEIVNIDVSSRVNTPTSKIIDRALTVSNSIRPFLIGIPKISDAVKGHLCCAEIGHVCVDCASDFQRDNVGVV